MTMKRISGLLPCLVALVVAQTAAAGGDPASVGLSGERLERLDRAVERAIEARQIAGAVVLIQRRGRLAWLEAYGEANSDSGRPMRTDDLFRIASMTKPITSAAVLMLYEEGHFLLNDPVGKYLPSFDRTFEIAKPADDGYELLPATKPITIRQLLTHTSGISYGFMNTEPLTSKYLDAGFGDGLSGENIVLADFVRTLAAMPLLHEPGQRFSYGLNTDVLGRLVEVVSGQPLDRFLAERLFEPLGMDDTWFEVPADAAGRLASVHRNTDDGRLAVVPPGLVADGVTRFDVDYPVDGITVFPSGGGGLSSTAEDYGRFLQMILNGGTLDGRRYLSRKTVELMTSNQLADLDDPAVGPGGFGLGFSLSAGPESGTIRSEGSFGWGGFFNTLMWADPEEDLVAVLLTQQYPYGIELLNKFPVLVYQAIDD